jgi:hypothetical protein
VSQSKPRSIQNKTLLKTLKEAADEVSAKNPA